jgi:hypothetical protein
VNRVTVQALNRAGDEIENAVILLPGGEDDDTLTAGEARQLRSMAARLNDEVAKMRNLADRAERRQRR